MAVLVLTLPDSVEAQSADWSVIDRGAVMAGGHLTFGQSADIPDQFDISHAVAILPSQAVFARRLSVPGRSDRDASRAAPFLIEEQLAEPLEDVRVEISDRLDDDTRWVFAVNDALAERWHRFALGLAIKPVYAVPDSALIETYGADLAAFSHGDKVLFKLGSANPDAQSEGEARDQEVLANETVFGALDRDLADELLPILAERLQPQRVLISDDINPDLTAPDAKPIALKRIPSPDVRLPAGELEQEALLKWPSVLGRALISQLDLGQIAKPWRTAAALAMSAVLAVTLFAIGQALYFDARTDTYRDAEIEAFQTSFPNITRVVNVQAQLRQQMATLGGVEGQGGFLELTAALTAIIGENESVQVESLRYDSDRGALAVTARYSDFGDFETLQQAALENGVVLDDGGARQADSGVLGDFAVRLQ